MEPIQLSYPSTLRGQVQLPASKSLSARALIISALAGEGTLHHLSDCDDTRVLLAALRQRPAVVDIEAAGTAMRFSTAYFATCSGETHVITGTERMQHRPIKVLVDALRSLGADITYEGAEGYPPLRVKGAHLDGGEVELPANVSSQYISALLMVGPTLQRGLTLRLIGEIVSRPYIEMTMGLMRQWGAQADWTDRQTISVAPQPYKRGGTYDVEPDWSAASYWYEMMALTSDADARLFLPGLVRESLQGDRVVADGFALLGVHSAFLADGVVLSRKSVSRPSCLELDFTECPDLAQTFVVSCALLGQPFRFSGLQSLRIKETDRIAALQQELEKLGVQVSAETITTDGKTTEVLSMHSSPVVHRESAPILSTYDDHRMAMAFAPAAMRCPQLHISHPEVVSKSYPSFWKDLSQAVGVEILPHDQFPDPL